MSRWNGPAWSNILTAMTNPFHLRSPRALDATVAVLALAPLPALAQDASAPVDAAPPAAAAPAVVSEPVVQAAPAAPIVLPDEPAAATTAATTATTAASTPSSRAVSSAAPRAASPAPVAVAAPAASSPAQMIPPPGAGPDAAPLASAPAPAPEAVAPVAAEAAPQPDANRGLEALALGGALAALGAGAIFAMTRRRRRVGAVDDRAIEPTTRAPFVPRETAPVVETPAQRSTYAAPAAAVAAAPVAASAQNRWNDGPVPMGSDRHAMIESMVAAAPDASNPFRSAKARRRRARLVLQGREQRLQDKAQQPFDFRQYRPSENADMGRKPAFA